MSSLSNIYTATLPLSKVQAKVMVLFTAVLFLILGAYARIPLPFTPVPVTLQTLFVLFSAAVLGRKFGPMAIAVYAGLGICGLPVFQGYGFGAAHLLGVTGGYVIGFFLAAFFIGYMADTSNTNPSFIRIFLVLLMGEVIIFGCGILWLMALLKIDVIKGICFGCVPFLPGEILKLFLAALLYRTMGARIRANIL